MNALLQTVKGMSSDIQAVSAAAEQDCKTPAPLIDQLHAEGVFSMTVAKDYGGLELDAVDSLSVIEESAYQESAVGWCSMIFATTAHLGSFLSPVWGQKIYGEGSRTAHFGGITAGAAAPSGKAVVVDGGLRVSGRWAWGSGSHHCDWICGGTVVESEGEVLSHDNGAPLVHVVFFERDQVELLDNWNPSGLRGTGSVDFVVDDVFVPDGRWTVLGVSKRQIDRPLFRFPFFGYFASAVAMVPLGIARRAIDEFHDLATKKTPAGRSSTLSQSSITQLHFGEAESMVEAAHTYLLGKVAQVWQKVETGERVTLEDKRQLRLAASQATQLSAKAVDLLYNAAGGTALQGDCLLQKLFRDIHAATQHRMVSPELLRLSAAARISEGANTAQL